MQEQEIAELLPLWASGKQTFQEIKGITTDELSALAHMGYVFLMQGKYDKSRVIFEGLIAINPKSDFYFRALGIIFHKMGQEERALKQFTYAIQVAPGSPYAYVNRAELYLAKGDKISAKEDLKFALDRISPSQQRLSKKTWALYQSIR